MRNRWLSVSYRANNRTKKGRGVCLSRLIYKILYYIALLNASDTAAAKA